MTNSPAERVGVDPFVDATVPSLIAPVEDKSATF